MSLFQNQNFSSNNTIPISLFGNNQGLSNSNSPNIFSNINQGNPNNLFSNNNQANNSLFGNNNNNSSSNSNLLFGASSTNLFNFSNQNKSNFSVNNNNINKLYKSIGFYFGGKDVQEKNCVSKFFSIVSIDEFSELSFEELMIIAL